MFQTLYATSLFFAGGFMALCTNMLMVSLVPQRKFTTTVSCQMVIVPSRRAAAMAAQNIIVSLCAAGPAPVVVAMVTTLRNRL